MDAESFSIFMKRMIPHKNITFEGQFEKSNY